jgi:hypothetical protein
MRLRSFVLFAASLLVGCAAGEGAPDAPTSLPAPDVSRIETVVRRDQVRLAWEVVHGEGRRFEVLRQNKLEPWKHFATLVVANGRLGIVDDGVVPGQRYTYRLRLYGLATDVVLDEITVNVPL